MSLLSAEMLEGTVPTRPASEKVPAVHGKIERRPVGWHKGVECYKRKLVAEPNSRLLTVLWRCKAPCAPPHGACDF